MLNLESVILNLVQNLFRAGCFSISFKPKYCVKFLSMNCHCPTCLPLTALVNLLLRVVLLQNYRHSHEIPLFGKEGLGEIL
jgi:hypothetical protein